MISPNLFKSLDSLLNLLKKNHRVILIIFFILWFFFEILSAGKVFILDYDEGVYLQTALQHAGGQTLYSELFLSQPPLVAEALSLVVRIFGNSVLASRALIILFGFSTVLATYFIAKNLFSENCALIALVLSGINFYLFYESRVAHANMPSLALALFSILGAVKYNKTRNLQWIVFSSLFFALANAFKLLEPFFAFPIAYLLIVPLFDEKNSKLEGGTLLIIIRNWGLFTAVFGAVLGGIFLNYHLPSLKEQVFGMGSSNVFHLSKKLRHMAGAYIGYQPGLFLFSITGLISIFDKNRKLFIFLALWIVSQLLFHALMSSWLNLHHLIVLFPVFVVVSSAGIDQFVINYKSQRGTVFSRTRDKPGTLYVVMGLFIILTGVPNLFMDVYLYKSRYTGKNFSAERELVAIIAQNTSPQDIVVSDYQMASFRANRFTHPELVDVSTKRVKTGNLKEEVLLELGDSPRMVIFWAGRLKHYKKYYDYVRKNYRGIYQSKGREIYINP
jgi:predicted membrane-bound mannosyltransferase